MCSICPHPACLQVIAQIRRAQSDMGGRASMTILSAVAACNASSAPICSDQILLADPRLLPGINSGGDTKEALVPSRRLHCRLQGEVSASEASGGSIGCLWQGRHLCARVCVHCLRPARRTKEGSFSISFFSNACNNLGPSYTWLNGCAEAQYCLSLLA